MITQKAAWFLGEIEGQEKFWGNGDLNFMKGMCQFT
jgi:hypothetical protein